MIKEGEHFRINSDEKYQPFKSTIMVREKRVNYGNGIKNNKPGGNTWNFEIWYRIVKYLDSLPASSAGKSEKVRKIQNLQSETEKELKLLEKAV